MPFILKTPTKLYLEDLPTETFKSIESYLAYDDNAVLFTYRSFLNNRNLRYQMSPDKWQSHKRSLEAQLHKTVLLKDNGGFYTYSGLAKELSDKFNIPVVNKIQYPKPSPLYWLSRPYDLRYYQEESKNLLLNAKHGAVSIAVGMGKSLIILNLVKELGLPAVVMVPFSSIANQLYDIFVKHLGKSKVGMYGDGHKEYGKLVTIAVCQALVRITPQDAAWKALASTQVLVSDESHLNPASTLAGVCMGLLGDAPYRFFLSGTQSRADGKDLILKGLINEIVYTKTIADGIKEKFLVTPKFTFYRMDSKINDTKSNANKLTQIHIYNNPQINKLAASIINATVDKMGHQTLALIDELEAFFQMRPLLKHPHKFAFSGSIASNKHKDLLPKEYLKPNPLEFVNEFNKMEFPILVGTSCISTGADICCPKTLLYMRGGKSETDFLQSLGRGVRNFQKDEYIKDSVNFIDFWIRNVPILNTHAEKRLAYAQAIGEVQIIDL